MTSKLAVVSLGLMSACASLAGAQTAEVKEKPPLYTYLGSFAIPRAKWGELEKQGAAEQKIFDKALSGGRLVGYGTDTELVHTADGMTHDSFWSSLSMAASKVPSSVNVPMCSSYRTLPRRGLARKFWSVQANARWS